MTDERLQDAQSVADELLTIAAQLEKRAPWQGAAKDAHTELAGHIRDAVSDYLGCKAYRDIRHELDQAEQSQEDAARGAERRDYFAKVL